MKNPEPDNDDLQRIQQERDQERSNQREQRILENEVKRKINPSLSQQQQESLSKLESSKCAITIQRGIVLIRNCFSLQEQLQLVQVAKELDIFNADFLCNNERAKNIHMKVLESRNIPPLILNHYHSMIRQVKEISPPIAPTFNPSKCVVNYYIPNNQTRLSLHDEQGEKGIVYSISLGDDCIFNYKNSWKRSSLEKKIVLRSGDLLVFGGCARNIVHGVEKIIPGSAPLSIAEVFKGRINFNLREK